ncbi:uncharacterized protein LOC144561947 [Carex rostrata]
MQGINGQTIYEIDENRKAKGKFEFQFASYAILLGFSELSRVKILPKNSVNEYIRKAISIFGSLALVAGFFLWIHTLFMLPPSNTFTHPIHHIISKGLIIFSYTALVTSLIPLSLLPSPYNLLISIILAAILLTLGVYWFLISKTNDKKIEKDQTQHEEQMKEIGRLSELSQVVVSLSIGGGLGLLIGMHINASNHAHHPLVLASLLLIFTAFLPSIFLWPFCEMGLIMNFSSSTRKKFLRIGVGLCKFLLVLLAVAAFAIAFTFLKWYTVMIFTPVLIFYAIWQSIELCTRDIHNIQDTFREEELKLAYTNAKQVTSLSFGGIIAIFSGYLGSDEKSMHLSIYMIFSASAFVSGLSLMQLSYKPSKRSNIDFVVSILSHFAIGLLAFGTFTIFLLEFMRH